MRRIADFLNFYKTEFLAAYNLMWSLAIDLPEEDDCELKNSIFEVFSTLAHCFIEQDGKMMVDDRIFYHAEDLLKSSVLCCYETAVGIIYADVSSVENLPNPERFINISYNEYKTNVADFEAMIHGVYSRKYELDRMREIEIYKRAINLGQGIRDNIKQEELRTYKSEEAKKLEYIKAKDETIRAKDEVIKVQDDAIKAKKEMIESISKFGTAKNFATNHWILSGIVIYIICLLFDCFIFDPIINMFGPTIKNYALSFLNGTLSTP